MTARAQRGGVVAGLAVVAAGAGYYLLAGTLPAEGLFGQMGSAEVPKLLASILMGLGLLLAVVSVLVPPAASEASDDGAIDRRGFWGTLAVMALTVPLWQLVGFLAAPFVAAGVMVANGERRVGSIAAVALVATALLYLVFFRLFGTPMPLGVLE